MKEILAYSLIILSYVFSPIQAQAQYEEIQTQYLSYPADDNTKFMVNNKYGNIICETWDKDSIGVFTTIKISSKKRESMQRILSSVNIEDITFGNTVEIETRFADNASLIKSYLGKLDPFNSNELTVHYEIKFPDGLEMEIINRFGNVMIEQTKSDIDVDLEYGNLHLEDMTGDLKLRLKTGRLVGRKLKRAELDARNFDIRLKYIEYALIEAQHCDSKIDEIDFARIDLSGGELDIEEVNTINGYASSQADINIELLKKGLEIEMKNSSILIEEFGEEVDKVTIDEVSSIIDLNISNLSFSLKADVEESQFSVPKTIDNIEKIVHDERKQIRSINFSHGAAGTQKTQVFINGVKGSIFLVED